MKSKVITICSINRREFHNQWKDAGFVSVLSDAWNRKSVKSNNGPLKNITHGIKANRLGVHLIDMIVTVKFCKFNLKRNSTLDNKYKFWWNRHELWLFS